MKAERKRFMSGKTSDVHRAATPHQQPKRQQKQHSAEDGSGTKANRGDFLTLQRKFRCLVRLTASEYTMAIDSSEMHVSAH